MLFDTDVLIWVFRGHAGAAARVEETADRRLSIVTLMELLQGCRDKREVRLVKSFLLEFGFHTLPLTETIGHRAVIYMEQHILKSRLRMADALIAATAIENNLALLSGDTRHYRALSDLELVAFKP